MNGQFHLGSSRQATYPIGLALDPVLRPMDKSIWATIKALLSENTQRAPTYADISATANCAKGTIAASLKRLRLMRWITSNVQRSPHGYVIGTEYTLHEWPLDSTTASLCDDTYADFVRQCTGDTDYVGIIATAVLKTISLEIEAGLCDRQLGHAESIARLKQYNRIVAQWAANHRFVPELGTYPIAAELIHGLRHSVQKLNSVDSDKVQKLNSVPSDSVQKLNSVDSDRVQKLNSVPKSLIHDSVQFSNSVPVSCSSSSNTTTTKAIESIRGLAFPSQLLPEECRIAGMHLATCQSELHQDLLDELGGQITAKARQGTPVRNPIGYLKALIRAVTNETFLISSPGLTYRQQRLDQAVQAAEDADRQSAATDAARKALALESTEPIDVEAMKASIAKRFGLRREPGT